MFLTLSGCHQVPGSFDGVLVALEVVGFAPKNILGLLGSFGIVIGRNCSESQLLDDFESRPGFETLQRSARPNPLGAGSEGFQLLRGGVKMLLGVRPIEDETEGVGFESGFHAWPNVPSTIGQSTHLRLLRQAFHASQCQQVFEGFVQRGEHCRGGLACPLEPERVRVWPPPSGSSCDAWVACEPA